MPIRLIGLVLALTITLAPIAARAQRPEQMREIGVVMAYKESDPNGQVQVQAFRQELHNIGYLKSAEAAAPSFRIKLVDLKAQSRSEIERVVTTFAAEPHGGLIVAPNVVNFANSDLIVALAARYRLPAIYPFAFYAKQGGLISYGFDAADQFRQGTVYADKILRGAKPADLPVQHPTKCETVINLKAAKALGLTLPPTVLLQADQVIE